MIVKGNIKDSDAVLKRIYGKQNVKMAGRWYSVNSFIVDNITMEYTAELSLVPHLLNEFLEEIHTGDGIGT